MRKVIIAAVVVLVLLFAAMFSLPYFIDINQHRGEIQAQLQQRLGRSVAFGAMSLGAFPPHVEVKDVVIGEDSRFQSKVPFAKVGEMDISVKLFPLLTKSIAIKSLSLVRPQIELIKDASGTWNFASLGQAPATPASAAPGRTPVSPSALPAAPAQPPASAGGEFSLDELKITDGQIAVTDLQQKRPRVVYDHIDLALRDFSAEKPFELDLAAHLPGKGAETIAIGGKAGPLNQTQMLATPFDGKLKLNEVSLSGVQSFLHSSALEGIDGVISGSTEVVNAGGKLSAKGSLKIADGVMNKVQFGYPIVADFDLTDDVTLDIVTIRSGELKLGSTPLSISGTLNTHATPGSADLSVVAKDASITDAARLAAAFGLAFNADTKISGKLSANLRAQGPTNNLAFNGTVNGRDLEISGKEIPRAVRVAALDLTLTPQEVRSAPFNASSGGTTLAGQLSIAQYTSPSPMLDATFKTTNGKVEELLNIAKAYGVSAVEGVNGTGAMTLDVRAAGPLKNSGAMTFSGSGAIQNAALKPPTLTQPINIRNASLQFSQNTLNFGNINASLGATNLSGNLSVANFQAPRMTFALSADKINVTELQKLFVASKPAPARKAESTWNLVPEVYAAPPASPNQGLLDTATGSGTINIGTLTYDRTTLSNVRSGVNLNHGVVELSPLTGQVFGGQINGSITADLRHDVSSFAVNAKLSGADANQLLSAVANTRDTLYGTLNASLNQTFSTPPSGDVTQTLNGPFTFTLTNGKLTKVDLVREIGKIAKFTGGNVAAGSGYTSISSMSATFDVRNGVAATNDLKGVLDVGTLSASGTMNLVNEALGMHMTALLSKQYSQSVGGTSVGGYLNTALANKNGELVIPVILSGTMSHPVVSPDVQKLAEMKLNNILPSAGGLLGTLLGGQGKQGQQGQQAGKPGQPSPQQQQLNTLQDALGNLLGGKKKPPK